MDEKWTKLIERYLQKELSSDELREFRNELENNRELQQELETHQLVREASIRSGQRKLVKKVGAKYHLNVTLKIASITIVMGLGIAALVFLFVKDRKSVHLKEETTLNILEVLNKEAEFDQIDPEYFAWNGADSVFSSNNGVLLSVPQGTFMMGKKTYKGKVVIQWQEAQQAQDIVKAGLSTTAVGELLETQGMFSIKAFTDKGMRLEINQDKGLYIQIPVKEAKEGMLLFEGVKDVNGNVDWQNPKPLEKLPVLANMEELNFYPPGYEAKLNELNWLKEKSKRDSMYLSFQKDWNTFGKKEYANLSLPEYVNFSKVQSRNYVENDYLSFFPSVTKAGANTFFVSLKVRMKPGCYVYANGENKKNKSTLSFDPLLEFSENLEYKLDGKFNEVGILDLVEKEGTKKTIYRNEVVYQQKIVTTSTNSIEVQFDYLAHAEIEGKSILLPIQRFSVILNSDFEEMIPIPPSKVLAIWNPKMNNTILATRDFEKRMTLIHKTCSEKVFNVYANQMNKAIWELDEEVVKLGYPEFQRFANERVGKVELSNPHMNNLRQYYEGAIAKLKHQARKNADFAEKLAHKWDKKVKKSRDEEKGRTQKRVEQALKEEIDLNMRNVMKQLGPSVGLTIHGGGTVYNVDKYVRDATIARKSTVITDPVTGKQATITYNEFKAEVKDAGKYGKLYLYLFPHELNSFQRIDPKNGLFNYTLNNDIQYDIALIGISDQGYFMVDKENVNKGNLGTVDLNKVSEEEFNRRIETLNNKRNNKPMKVNSELDWLMNEQKDYKVQLKRKEDRKFRNGLRTIVFPCYAQESYVGVNESVSEIPYGI
jgi:hypothetical protein